MVAAHLRGFVAGLLLSMAVGAAWAWVDAGRGIPPLTDAERSAAIRAKYVPVEVVKTIVQRVEVPGEPLPPVVERVVVEVPGEVVEIEVPVDAPPGTADCGPVELWGGCEIDLVGDGVDRMARASWWASASGPFWSAARGPIVSDEVEYQIAEVAAPSKWSRRLWFGAMRAGSGYGPTFAAALERRRWAAQVGVGVLFDAERGGCGPECYDAGRGGSTEPVLFVSFSRRGR